MNRPRRHKIYLDTSAISHLDAPDTPERMAATLDFWQTLENNDLYDVYVSELVDREINGCPEPKRSLMQESLLMVNHSVLRESIEVRQLAKDYLDFGLLSSKNEDDLLHIAYAVTAGCSFIISWNFRHLVNSNTLALLTMANLYWGLPTIQIVTPEVLRGKPS